MPGPPHWSSAGSVEHDGPHEEAGEGAAVGLRILEEDAVARALLGVVVERVEATRAERRQRPAIRRRSIRSAAAAHAAAITAHPGAIMAHPGAIMAPPGAIMAPPGAITALGPMGVRYRERVAASSWSCLR